MAGVATVASAVGMLQEGQSGVGTHLKWARFSFVPSDTTPACFLCFWGRGPNSKNYRVTGWSIGEMARIYIYWVQAAGLVSRQSLAVGLSPFILTASQTK